MLKSNYLLEQEEGMYLLSACGMPSAALSTFLYSILFNYDATQQSRYYYLHLWRRKQMLREANNVTAEVSVGSESQSWDLGPGQPNFKASVHPTSTCWCLSKERKHTAPAPAWERLLVCELLTGRVLNWEVDRNTDSGSDSLIRNPRLATF